MNSTFNILDSLALVHLSGADTDKFLQGQLTYDLVVLQPNQHQLSAHCDPKGKTWAALRLWRQENDIYYLVPKSIAESQLKELKKYAVFSKVTINTVDDTRFTFIQSDNTETAEQWLNYFGENTKSHFLDHTCLITQETTLLKLSATDYLLVHTSSSSQTEFLNAANTNLPLKGEIAENAWLSWQIQQGIAVLSEKTTNQFIPQAMNLQALDAISFTKGCYTGQEMVARAKYRGANKRALYCLVGKAENLPEIGSSVEMQLGENWRETGTILASAKAESETYLQVILNHDLADDTHFRLPQQSTSQFKIVKLPYGLLEE